MTSSEPRHIAAHIVELAGTGQRLTINFVNAHCVNVAHRDASYRRALRVSDMLLPDGIGIELAARMSGAIRPENLNGTDLFPLICERAAVEGTGLFLLGGMPGVADGAAAWACGQYPSLRIRGTHDGFFPADEEDALVERINASGAGILLVGLGVPLQEEWLARNRARLDVPVVMGVGGLFDYYSGRIARAPKMVRDLRAEWAWRLAMEPRRMAGRYLVGNAVFLAHAALECARQRGWQERMGAAAKRLFDIAGASLALLALLPLFLLTAIAIRMEDRGPVFFRQQRVGAGGRTFSMIKFRSMFTDAEERRAALLASSDHPYGQDHPSALDRRTAATVQRARWQHVSGRPASGTAERSRRLSRPPVGPPRWKARHHLHLASEGPRRNSLPASSDHGSRLPAPPHVGHRSEAAFSHRSCSAWWTGRLLSVEFERMFKLGVPMMQNFTMAQTIWTNLLCKRGF